MRTAKKLDIAEYVIPQLMEYRNVSLPEEDFKKYGKEKLEKYLTKQCKFNVKIRIDTINSSDNFVSGMTKFTDTYYIAEKTERRKKNK